MYTFVIIASLFMMQPTHAIMYDVVPPGHVGIYYRWGSTLMANTTQPGLYPKMPWPYTSASEIEVRPQTDRLKNVRCGTKDGTLLYFPEVQVGNQLDENFVISTVKRFGEDYDMYLIKDKVRHQINVICSSKTSHQVYIEEFDTLDDELVTFLQTENDKLATGIQINFVRFDKPILPSDLQANYDRIANAKTGLKHAVEENARLAQVHANKILIAEKEAQAEKKKAEIESQKKLEQAIKDEETSIIRNRMHMKTEKTKADAVLYAKQKEAEGNDRLLTRNYVSLEKARAMAGNAKHYFGDVPNALFLKDADVESHSHQYTASMNA